MRGVSVDMDGLGGKLGGRWKAYLQRGIPTVSEPRDISVHP